jgi:hypothetical protein
MGVAEAARCRCTVSMRLGRPRKFNTTVRTLLPSSLSLPIITFNKTRNTMSCRSLQVTPDCVAVRHTEPYTTRLVQQSHHMYGAASTDLSRLSRP